MPNPSEIKNNKEISDLAIAANAAAKTPEEKKAASDANKKLKTISQKLAKAKQQAIDKIKKEETVNEDSYDIQLDKLIGDHKGSLSDADFNAHLEKNKNKGSLWAAKMKQTYEKRKKADPEKEMDTRRLARKGIEDGGLEEACWDGYKAIGTKEKNGKRVPNCVPEAAQTHRVLVSVKDKSHTMATKRDELIQKTIRVTANSKEEAVTKAKAFYKKKGYTVSDAEYIETLKDSVAFKVVSLLTGSSDTAKIERFLESYKLDLSSYNSFDLTEAFKKFKA